MWHVESTTYMHGMKFSISPSFHPSHFLLCSLGAQDRESKHRQAARAQVMVVHNIGLVVQGLGLQGRSAGRWCHMCPMSHLLHLIFSLNQDRHIYDGERSILPMEHLKATIDRTTGFTTHLCTWGWVQFVMWRASSRSAMSVLIWPSRRAEGREDDKNGRVQHRLASNACAQGQG